LGQEFSDHFVGGAAFARNQHCPALGAPMSPAWVHGIPRVLRSSPAQGDLQVNLLPKGKRTRASHAIALDLRHRMSDLPKPAGTVVKVVEAPPGPPVLATLLAEAYGPNEAAQGIVQR
jgi:hypothetical protein